VKNLENYWLCGVSAFHGIFQGEWIRLESAVSGQDSLRVFHCFWLLSVENCVDFIE
jgi:hypothetical protein